MSPFSLFGFSHTSPLHPIAREMRKSRPHPPRRHSLAGSLEDASVQGDGAVAGAISLTLAETAIERRVRY
jgi:hypothetical protein